MKIKNLAWSALLGLAMTGIAAAAEDKPAADAQKGPGGEGHRQMPPEMRERMLKEFDKDSDGKLNDAEKEAAKAAGKARMDQRRAAMEKMLDTNGDGTVSEEEKAAAKAKMEARRAEMLKKADTNNDGQVSPEERQAAIEAQKAEFIKKYDKDSDGKLNEEERKAAQADMPPGMGGPGGPGGRGHRGPGAGGPDKGAAKPE